MPWLPNGDLREVLLRLDLLREPRNCPGCKAAPGGVHKRGCALERCSGCGGQRVSCGCEKPHDKFFARWTGFWPGELECIALGLLSHWDPDPTKPVPADALCSKVGADLNRFISEGWHTAFWIKPARR